MGDFSTLKERCDQEELSVSMDIEKLSLEQLLDLNKRIVRRIQYLHGLKAPDALHGKTYQSRLKVGKGGLDLAVRGYIGVSLLGRSQTWRRVSRQ